MPYFWSSCSLFKLEYFAHFWFFGILIYDIHNKISNLELLGHFYFWPYKRPRGHMYIFFVLKLIQQWLVGHFEGLTKSYQPTQNDFEIPSTSWEIPLSSTSYHKLDFGLYWGWIEARTQLLGMIQSIRFYKMPVSTLVILSSELSEIFNKY